MLNLYANIDFGFANAMEFIHLEKYEVKSYHVIAKNKKEAVLAFDLMLQKILKANTNYINIINSYEYTKYDGDISHFVFTYAVTPVPIKDKDKMTGELLAYNENMDIDSINDYLPLPPEIIEALKRSEEALHSDDKSKIIEIDNHFDAQVKRDEISENIEHALAEDGLFKPMSFKLTDEQVLAHTKADRDFYRAAYLALSKLHGTDNEEI